MTPYRCFLPTAVLLLAALPLRADEDFLKDALGKEVIGPRQSLLDLQDYLEAKIPRLPAFETKEGWQKYADRLRDDILTRVVYRGEAARWRDAKVKVEYGERVPMKGGEGYTIRKLAYEVLPGMWVPALLYEPAKLEGKVPVALAVNGHDRKGKAADYKQVRCINLAKRGILVLNVEWFGMGQLKGDGYGHYRMNQLDLCGTSGLAPFYLSMVRGLDVLLAHRNADPKRVCVSGLSGGGWQTIWISSLDRRVTLSNPVAGYSPFLVKIRDHYKDLGDSEQTPCDFATLADYTHLTTLRAPRPTLLTYNAKDDCCFESGYALPPLLKAAGPLYKLLGAEGALRSHVNHDPGTHNYLKENREAFYKVVGEFFFKGDPSFKNEEIPCAEEVRSAEELDVPLPAGNHDFNTLAKSLMKGLPRGADLPGEKKAASAWQAEKRRALAELLKVPELDVKATQAGGMEKGDIKVTFWKLRLGGEWTVPVVELVRGAPKGTVVLLDDSGRKSASGSAHKLLESGQRVLAVDPFYFGESRVQARDFLFALLLSCVGDRPLGLQARQVQAVCRWACREFGAERVSIHVNGPRLGLAALAAAALEDKVGRLELTRALGSLKEVIEQNRGVNEMPEMFCFGLLEALDVKQLAALCAPRQVVFHTPSERVRKELAGLGDWYKLLGREHDPVKEKRE